MTLPDPLPTTPQLPSFVGASMVSTRLALPAKGTFGAVLHPTPPHPTLPYPAPPSGSCTNRRPPSVEAGGLSLVGPGRAGPGEDLLEPRDPGLSQDSTGPNLTLAHGIPSTLPCSAPPPAQTESVKAKPTRATALSGTTTTHTHSRTDTHTHTHTHSFWPALATAGHNQRKGTTTTGRMKFATNEPCVHVPEIYRIISLFC